MNVSIRVFDELLIQASAAESGAMTSSPFAAIGNKAVTAVTVSNISTTSSANKLKVKLQGSYDGLAWSDLTMAAVLEFDKFGYADSATSDLDVAWVRVHVEGVGLSGSETLAALIDAHVAFSEQ